MFTGDLEDSDLEMLVDASDDPGQVWVCDGIAFGCKVEGTERRVTEHVLRSGMDETGEMLPDDQVTCWGAMAKDGQAYADLMDRNIHPMTAFTGQFGAMLLDRHSHLLPQILGPGQP